MKLTPQQIASVARQAGFTGDDLTTAVAIALAESGGNPAAYNAEKQAHTPEGEGSYGLWQIYEKAHPDFIGWNLSDPQTNANAAFIVYSQAGDSFHPWSTYKFNAYQAYVDTAQTGVDA